MHPLQRHPCLEKRCPPTSIWVFLKKNWGPQYLAGFSLVSPSFRHRTFQAPKSKQRFLTLKKRPPSFRHQALGTKKPRPWLLVARARSRAADPGDPPAPAECAQCVWAQAVWPGEEKADENARAAMLPVESTWILGVHFYHFFGRINVHEVDTALFRQTSSSFFPGVSGHGGHCERRLKGFFGSPSFKLRPDFGLTQDFPRAG